MPSAWYRRPPATTSNATCGQPPMRRVHCSITAGSPRKTVVVVGALQSKRSLMPERQGLLVATDIIDAVSPGPASLMRAAGCCHVPQNTSNEPLAPDGSRLQLSPLAFCPRLTPLLPCESCGLPPT